MNTHSVPGNERSNEKEHSHGVGGDRVEGGLDTAQGRRVPDRRNSSPQCSVQIFLPVRKAARLIPGPTSTRAPPPGYSSV